MWEQGLIEWRYAPISLLIYGPLGVGALGKRIAEPDDLVDS